MTTRCVRVLRAAIAWSALTIAFCAASTAAAGTIDKTGASQLTLKVGGDIQSACGLAHVKDVSLGDLTQADLIADTDVGLQCNVPFNVTVKSDSGGLRNTRYPDGNGPYAGVRGYELTFAMSVQTPDSNVITNTFSAQQLASGQTISSGGGIASSGAHIHMILDQLTDPGLAAGDYSETIELSISPTL
jgi:hypothetical protein